MSELDQREQVVRLDKALADIDLALTRSPSRWARVEKVPRMSMRKATCGRSRRLPHVAENDDRSSKPSDRHEPPLSAEQLALNAQQDVARSRGRDGSEPSRARCRNGR
jgi:hypothetical protein